MEAKCISGCDFKIKNSSSSLCRGDEAVALLSLFGVIVV